MPTVTIEQVPEGQYRANMWIARLPGDEGLRVSGASRSVVENVVRMEAGQRFPDEPVDIVEVPWVFRPEEVEPASQPVEEPSEG
jgi:hypothetical protein